MLTFEQLREDLEGDVVNILKGIGVSELEINYDEGYVAGTFDTKDKVKSAVEQIPENVDYEIEVMLELADGDDEEVDSADDIAEIDMESLNDEVHMYEIYVYLDNAAVTEAKEEDDDDDDDDDDEKDDDDEEMNEARKRVVKVNSKGQRRIKIKCGKGFKFDGKKCIKIGGTEKIKKRKAIKKSVRTKRAKGKGAQRKATRLRLKAHKKRKSMGLNRR